jgi:hypothetical protein
VYAFYASLGKSRKESPKEGRRRRLPGGLSYDPCFFGCFLLERVEKEVVVGDGFEPSKA